MSKLVKIVADSDGQFEMHGVPVKRGITDQYAGSFSSPLLLNRTGEGQGFILNVDDAVIHIGYYLKVAGEDGENNRVGPKHHMLRPGEHLEIGCGPGVEWRLHHT